MAKTLRLIGTILFIALSAIGIFFCQTYREISDTQTPSIYKIAPKIENRFYDFRMKYTLTHDIENRVVLAKIDDKSISEIGRYPWTRTVYADLLNKLKVFGAKIVSFDVIFPEEEKACYDQNESADSIFSQAILDFQQDPTKKVIISYLNELDLGQKKREIPDVMYNFVLDSKQTNNSNLQKSTVIEQTFPIQILQDTEVGLGHIQTHEDPDGIFRHYTLLSNIDEIYFPSLAYMSYQYYSGDKGTLILAGEDDYKLKLKTGELPILRTGESKVRYLGGINSFPSLSIVDILKASDNDSKIKELINGNIVYVGSTSIGAHDLRHTPIDSKLPGVYFHMNMTNMLLEGRFFKPQNESAYLSWLLLIIGTLFILVIMSLGNALFDVAALFFTTIMLLYYDIYHLIPDGHQVSLSFILLAILSCYSWNTFINFYFSNKDKKFLKKAFGNYISPELIDQMYKKGEAPKLGGESGQRTAFFTDIQNFSTFSEQLSATKLVELLNEYLTAMTDILLNEKGTLDKYEGDAIIAFFGAPMPLEDHAKRSCVVALKMQNKLLELRQKWVQEGNKWPSIVHEMRMRIGINSGEIVTGNMGSRDRMNYTMMGDSVNLAARLEEAAKQYGIFIHLSENTKKMCSDHFIWRELDTIRVVGKTEPITTYELLNFQEASTDLENKLSALFSKALLFYKSKKWDNAIETFKQTLELEYLRFPKLKGVKTNPSEVYIQRCLQFKKNPPEKDWDGVFKLNKK